ncbi:hypothetical protein V6R21_31055 [Limibacter armeniacum]|uniref:hypothetical protein n=1 Tax=Limibacter armeniacum TaxID=466084 RepID=UPI002FE622D2
MKKLSRKVSFFLLIHLHITFLSAILFERMEVFIAIGSMIVLFLLMGFSYLKSPLHEHDHTVEDYSLIVFVMLGASASYCLNVEAHLGPVLAAGIVGVFASFIPSFSKKSEFLKQVPPALYCGAFVGMSQEKVAHDHTFIIIASFVSGMLLVHSKNVFNGFGGKLGTIAFGGVTVTSLFLFFLF